MPHPDGPAEPNPYLLTPRSTPPSEAAAGIEELETSECWRLIETAALGRLAITGADDGPEVFPMNYLVHDGSLFVRSAPGRKLRDLVSRPVVAFEVDGQDAGRHWSVVIRATAHRLDADDEIEASGVLGLVSWSPTAKQNFVQLRPLSVTGRRFPDARARSGATPAGASGATDGAASASASVSDGEATTAKTGRRGGPRAKPLHIPHLPPPPER